MVLYQSWKDLKKEKLWAWIYMFIMTVVLTMLLLQIDTIYSIWRKNVHLYQFEKNNIFCSTAHNICMKTEYEKSISKNNDILETQRLGGFYILTNDDFSYVEGNYPYIIVFTGCYVKNMGLDYGTQMQCYLMQKNDKKTDTIRINNYQVPVAEKVSNKFDIFHPTIYMGHDDEILQNSLIVCCKNIATAQTLFPISSTETDILNTLILENPTDEECTYFEKALYQSYGKYFEFCSAKEYSKNNVKSTTKHCLFELLFTLITLLLLLRLLFGNLKQMIEHKKEEYLIHYLYGEPMRMLQRRAGGFMILLHIPPFLGIFYELQKNHYYFKQYGYYLINPHRAIFFLIILLCLLIVLYFYLFCHVGKLIITANGLGNLRRKHNDHFIC